MLCPRRSEIGNSSVFKFIPAEDSYGKNDTCSYCGSLNPDTFMERLEAGSITIGPTDKNYKVYVSGEGLSAMKFYFQHLSEDQMRRFVDLHNEKKIKFDGTGGFYCLPFFMVYPA